MKYALAWLREYTAFNSDPEKLGERLIMTTAEVEESLDAPLPVQDAVVAEVIKVSPHPNADRLRLVTVDTKRGEREVVCGAPNVLVGMKVPYLESGSRYQDDSGEYRVLASATIRGVTSNGMLASEHDLGLSNNHDGLLELPADSTLHTSVAELLGWQLPVLNLEITPNRGDLLSYLGLAREISWLEKTRLDEPRLLGNIDTKGGRESRVKVSLQTPGCHRYAALVIEGLQNVPSPLWLRNRLRQSGIDSINAAVDITNYVMLELGQPLHAFDAAKLTPHRGNQLEITVRPGQKGDKLACLDHKTRSLDADDLVIASGSTAVALAGVIGGEETAVTEATTTVLLEAAIFDPGTIRRSSQKHALRTEAVTRFEKGIDPELPVKALKRAAYLLREVCGAEPAGPISDSGAVAQRRHRLTVDLTRASRVLGIPLNKKGVQAALRAIGFEAVGKESNYLEISIPTWRLDIQSEEDIYEEIVRLTGYDQLPSTLPAGPIAPHRGESSFELHRQLKTQLAAHGLREVVSQAFISDTEAEEFNYPPKTLLRVANPPSRHETYTRPELLPALLKRLARDSRENETLSCFELGHVFRQTKDAHTEADHLALAVLTSDPLQATRQIKAWLQTLPSAAHRLATVTFEGSTSRHPSYLAAAESIKIDQAAAGQLGPISTAQLKRLKIRGRRFIVAAEIDLAPLFAAPTGLLAYRPVSTYPAVVRDVSLRFSSKINYGVVVKLIETVRSSLLESREITDIYEDNETKGLTVRLTFRSNDRTLRDEEVVAELDHLLQQLKARDVTLAQ